MQLLTVAPRYCSTPGEANAGYVAGLLAQHARAIVRVDFLMPLPLGAPLEVAAGAGGRLELRRDGAAVAAATPASLDLEVPRPPGYLAAIDASRRHAGFAAHPTPRCFVCGPERARGDGLRIFAGPPASGGGAGGAPAGGAAVAVAAPWVPDVVLGLEDHKVRPEFMWAALGCPGCRAVRSDGAALRLKQFTAHVDRRVHVDEPCVIIGWRVGGEAEGYPVGTALFDEDGDLCAQALALWTDAGQ
jgi:hypothetical protein